MNLWMSSPTHRGNILDDRFQGMGVGCAQSSTGKVYYCQVFVSDLTGEPTIVRNADLQAGGPTPPSDTTAPAAWTGFGPRNANTLSPTCRVRVTDAGVGLNVWSARFRFSRDAGATWSSWYAAACTGLEGTILSQEITAAGVPFNQESRQNRIQFQIADVNGNVGVSPLYEVRTDVKGPGPWTAFTPLRTSDTTPDCAVQVRDALSGLRVSRALYRYSTDSGATFSAWFPAACTGADGTTAVQTITATGVPFNNAHASRNRIQFLIQDMAQNWCGSPWYTVNTTPP
jgi:hypothetical protein